MGEWETMRRVRGEDGVAGDGEEGGRVGDGEEGQGRGRGSGRR